MSGRRELVFPHAVDDPRDLFGREQQLKQIREELHRPARRTVVLLGGRLVGKTSLLNVVTHRAEGDPSYRVIRLAHASSREKFMAEIVHGILEGLGDVPETTGDLFGRDRTLHTGTVARFVRVVQTLAAEAGDARFLLCVDELDSFLRGCTDQAARQILDLVLHLTEHTRLPIRFLFTMSRIPEQVRLAYGSPFLNQASIVELRPWPAGRSRAFADWLLDGRWQLGEAAHTALYAAAGGHPYFTKAVLRAVLDSPPAGGPGDPLPAGAVTAAARAAAGSREVDIALSNIATGYLPRGAAAVLDRVAGAPGGLATGGLRGLPASAEVLETLTDTGLLGHDGRRYVLRLGVWRLWRGSRGRGGVPRRAVGVLRWPRWRLLQVAVVTGLALLALVAAGPLVFFPNRQQQFTPCQGAASGLTLTVRHPSYVSIGDEHELRVVVVNRGPDRQRIDVSVVVIFPPGTPGPTGAVTEVTIRDDDTELSLDRLHAGQPRARGVGFTPLQPGRLLPDTGAAVAVRLRVIAAGAECLSPQLSVPVAPLPYLRKAQGGALTLVFLPLATMVIEMAARRLVGSHRQVDAADRPPDPTTGGR
jgi:hypothetical protein